MPSKDSWARISAHLRSNEGRIAALLSKFIRVNTTNPPGLNYEVMVGILERECRRLGLETQRVRVPPKQCMEVLGQTRSEALRYPRINLIARWNVGAPSTLNFSSHFDVVSASPLGWTSPPFKPSVRRGRLFGRGAADMKGAIVAILAAIEAVKAAELTPNSNLECVFTVDEESGGQLGLGYLAKSGYLRAQHGVICEGAGGNEIGLGHRGVLWWEVTIIGRSAHGSRPEKGVNAFELACSLGKTIAALNPKFSSASRRSRLPWKQKIFPSICLGGVARGDQEKVNILPGRFTFSIDRRIAPGETVASVTNELHAVIQSFEVAHPQCRVELKPLFESDPCLNSLDSHLWAQLAKAVRAVRRRQPTPVCSLGFTDMHYLMDCGIDAIEYGPQGENLHGTDESVPLKELITTSMLYSRLIASFAAAK